MSRVGPVNVLKVAPSETDLVMLPDGRLFRDADVTIPPDQIEQIRVGYRCVRCLEPQSVAFPEICESVLPDGVTPWCSYPIKEKQTEEFEWRYGGETHLLNQNDRMNEEILRLRELDDYEERTGVVLPDAVKFPTTIREEG